MKRICNLLLSFCLVLGLCACAGAAPTWQEQYDLGVKYLSEGNYEEAIIAFTAAIEIDPKQADAYIGLAEVYTAQGDIAKALEILEQGLEIVNDPEMIRNAMKALDGVDSTGTLNEYGAVEFTKRMGYCPVDELPSETIQLLEQTKDAMSAGDIEAIRALVEGKESAYFYTNWNGYKVYLCIDSGRTQETDSDFQFFFCEIQMRPENGMGYTCDLWYQGDIYHDANAHAGTKESHYNQVKVSACPCVNWQWDGELQGNRWWKHWDVESDGTEDGGEAKATIKGSIKNNLREGTFTEEGVRETWGYTNSGVESYTSTTVYSGGECVEDNGRAVDYSGFCSAVGDSEDDILEFFW